MPRREDWQVEIDLAKRRELWTLSGPMGLVKVLPLRGPRPKALTGYITVAKNLIGCTPRELEQVLGLPKDYLVFGARIFRFSRIPQPSEYTYELTAYYPDGQAYSTFMSDDRYQPGSSNVHQWKIRENINIPVRSDFLKLLPDTAVPASWVHSYK